MSVTFLSIGECMVELAPLDVDGHYKMGFAGDTLNTAWYAAQRCPQWQVDYVTRIGQDGVSDQMLGFLADAGIGTDRIGRAEDRTAGLYMISLARGERSFSYWRGQSAARTLADDPAWLDTALDGGTLIYFSGITLGILDGDGRANLIGALARQRAAGATIAFDSNLRPQLWPSTDIMCAAVMEAAAMSDIVLPSHDDEATYFGDTDPEATLGRYLDAGATTVVVKNGAGPMTYARNGAKGTVIPDAVAKVVDSTAAGDSFNAGFFCELETSGNIEAAIRAGAGLAGRVIGGRGALVELD
jgi:2-dehydro-3-deoxygluconokinase